MTSTYIAGIDLGQAADYTAVTIVEKHTGTRTDPARYDVRHLERFALGTAYPAVVARTTWLLDRLPTGTKLVVDGTGVGRAVVDMFAPLGRRLVPVTITAGDAATLVDRWWRVPKRELVGVIQVLLQTGRLKIAAGLAEAPALTGELLGFQVKITASATDVYGAWREGQHDDLVLALALPLWYAERVPTPASFRPVAGGSRPIVEAARARMHRDMGTPRGRG